MTKHTSKIGLIGFGNMGSAIYDSLIENYSISSIYACDRNQDKLNGIRSDQSVLDADKLIDKVDVIILAIKPQSFDELLECIDLKSLQNKLIISVMAGVSISRLEDKLGTRNIIRSMPNLAVKQKLAFTGWIAHKTVLAYHRLIAKQIFDVWGQNIELKDENDIDKVTAITGSGPGYLYYIGELIQKEAMKMGFDEKQSTIMSNAILIGAGAHLKDSGNSAKELKQKVTSKGGTTESALKYFARNDLSKVISGGIRSAYRKSKKLSS